jgi:hypothetical protein
VVQLKRCGTCEHWEKIGTDLMSGPYGQCKKIQSAGLRNSKRERPLAMIEDDCSSFSSDLATLADFGCVLWEPKAVPE